MLSFEDNIFIKNLWECKRFSACVREEGGYFEHTL